jgi:hypothetical protein
MSALMSSLDRLYLGVPAIASGIPILINIYTTITVLFLVLGCYLGVNASVEDKDMKTALAALSALVALGGFALRQWVKYRRALQYHGAHRQHLLPQHQQQFRDLRLPDRRCRGAGVQGGVSRLPLLAYAPAPPTADELARRAADWLRKAFGVDVTFNVGEATKRLERLGLLATRGGRLFVSPLDAARVELGRVWDGFFPRAPQITPQ